MPSVSAIYAWLLTRALLYIALVSALLYAGTRKPRIVRAYALAHALALGGGAAFDLTMYKFFLHSHATVGFLEWAYAAPIFLFTAISLYICHWEGPLNLADVLLPLATIVAWACAIVFGPQKMDGFDVIGAWFVSAGTGGVDLFSLHGPRWAAGRKYATRLLGYAAVLAAVYVLLPLTSY